jgi:glucokinase
VLLVGDIGGTHTRLRLLAPSGRVVRHDSLDSRAHKSLEAAVAAFLGKPAPRVRAAAFGIAGPVVGGRCVATNLPWVVDERLVARKLGIRRVKLLNDLVALGLGAIGVAPSKRRVLGGAGAPRKKGASVAVIAAGTGLGEALLVWDGEKHVPTATEGGHCDFGPNSEVEADLWRYLHGRLGHVSYERVISGMGLGNIYDFFREARGMGESADHAAALLAAADRNALIAQLGMSGASATAAAAVDLFVTLYGAEAGNLALKSLSLGGVLVCGNIAARMLPVIERGGFLRAFRDKGRFAKLMETIPVAVVLDSDVGLAGVTRVARGG